MKSIVTVLSLLFASMAFADGHPPTEEGVGTGGKLKVVYVEVCDMRRVGDDYEVIEGTCRMEKRIVNYTSGGSTESGGPGSEQ